MDPSPTTGPLEAHKLLTRAQAADYLQLTEQTLRKWAVRRTGPAFLKVGRAVRYDPADLREFIAVNRIEAA